MEPDTLDFPSIAARRSAERVEHLRAQQQNTPPPEAITTHEDAPSSVVRTLTSQLSALKQRHRTR